MHIIDTLLFTIEASVKQRAVTLGLLRYIKDVKTKTIFKTRIGNTTKDRLLLGIFNSQLHRL